MNSTTAVSLQAFATLCLAIATEQFTSHSYLAGSAIGLLGLVAYAAYELIPMKP